MQEDKLYLGDDTIMYHRMADGVRITSYHGNNPVVEVPEQIQGSPVVCIGKKAFLGRKSLKKLVLPKTIRQIEDWAFANCDRLEEIVLSTSCEEYGKGVFQGCRFLKKILPAEEKEITEKDHQIGNLLAATISLLDAPHLFTPELAGSSQWLKQWDSKLLQYLHTRDKQGFTVVVLCGEEDYGSDENSLSYFIRKKRQAKVRLCFLRLLNPVEIGEETQKELRDYLREHSKGGISEETWQVVLEEHGNEREYYQMMMDCDCIHKDNIEGYLEDLGDNYPEMKSFLLQYKQEKLGVEDFFMSFTF